MRIILSLFLILTSASYAEAALCPKAWNFNHVLQALDKCDSFRKAIEYKSCVAGYQYAATVHFAGVQCQQMPIKSANYCYDVTPSFDTYDACYKGARTYINDVAQL